MSKRVLVVVSGDTERTALPELLRHLDAQEIALIIRQSPHGVISPEVAKKVIVASWWDLIGDRIDKVVVLVDADASDPEEKEAQFHEMRVHLQSFAIPIFVVAAKWHLEAWFFADAGGLRAALGRALGRIKTSPDEIERPKHRLRDLLGGVYTAAMAGEIAAAISPEVVRGSSPSFERFERSVLNGDSVGTRSSA